MIRLSHIRDKWIAKANMRKKGGVANGAISENCGSL